MIPRLLFIASILVMWISTPMVARATSAQGDGVATDDVTVSLPIYVTSLITTAVATWIIARHDNSRERQIDRLERDLHKLSEQFGRQQKPKD